MTLAVYVPAVPEFAPVVRTAEAAGMDVRAVGDYLELATAEREVVLRREVTEMPTAVWHAALTGGLTGRIVSFTPRILHLATEDHA
ncbi:hypothetical protein ACFXN2_25740 [Streptomyces kronopolitis]|uniref:Uncharacterized protein n=1 Tax=Streptomyces kronopolitis TaxID=1612435 RepID=A0ABQ2JXN3_9ACTN|nr:MULTISPECIES: hypothetical protein [Streptomyces]MCL6296838.1 hypothetical protein [Streptomyces kronopolitis]GGN60511.1 hypothetical protein GCM10012285_58650 [Streptomyces kronopolitis]GLW17580.1 hypothetical protein Stsp01_43230 [Streptomyces sp. NBRC 13847]